MSLPCGAVPERDLKVGQTLLCNVRGKGTPKPKFNKFCALFQNYEHFLKTSISSSWVIDQNNVLLILTNNSGTVWATEILVTFWSYSDNLLHGTYIIFQTSGNDFEIAHKTSLNVTRSRGMSHMSAIFNFEFSTLITCGDMNILWSLKTLKNIICHRFKPVTQNQYSRHPTHSPWSCHKFGLGCTSPFAMIYWNSLFEGSIFFTFMISIFLFFSLF